MNDQEAEVQAARAKIHESVLNVATDLAARGIADVDELMGKALTLELIFVLKLLGCEVGAAQSALRHAWAMVTLRQARPVPPAAVVSRVNGRPNASDPRDETVDPEESPKPPASPRN